MPKRIQRKRTKGWRLPAGAVCVTRPGKWGNPYPTKTAFRGILESLINPGCVPLDMAFDIKNREHMARIARDIEELRGKDLACWCKEDAECHADVLLEFANRGE